MSAKGRSWRTGGDPARDIVLSDHDHDMITEAVIPDSVEHARRLCGGMPYSMAQVKPVESAAVIFRLVGILRRIIASRSYVRMREMERTVKAQRFELVLLRAARSKEAADGPA